MLIFCREIKKTIQNIADDTRCEVHQSVLGIREGKEGWFHLYCPGGIACDDDGELYGIMVSQTLNLCNVSPVEQQWSLVSLYDNFLNNWALSSNLLRNVIGSFTIKSSLEMQHSCYHSFYKNENIYLKSHRIYIIKRMKFIVVCTEGVMAAI